MDVMFCCWRVVAFAVVLVVAVVYAFVVVVKVCGRGCDNVFVCVPCGWFPVCVELMLLDSTDASY